MHSDERPMSSEFIKLAEDFSFELRSIGDEDESCTPWYAKVIENPYLGKVEITFDEEWFTLSIDNCVVFECKHEGYRDVKKRIKYFLAK
jgi:hypothetical protein